jgi:hypothetical protein
MSSRVNAEAGSRGSSNVALELSSRRSENAATSVGVCEAAVAETVTSGAVTTSDAVLTVT